MVLKIGTYSLDKSILLFYQEKSRIDLSDLHLSFISTKEYFSTVWIRIKLGKVRLQEENQITQLYDQFN
ncbi:MAG: hypothetical protein A3D31_05580 [Candidatus Fluviicola riflensis]|nr:MAG: hypothetical protein CHH17_09435 [Candidatus Fluviicola riflensis]OGS79440.1 MAG: hypothetical protein A3D31_05580 [Candidatus Fluviicola riflensis]OGS86872.1 MAG: hypothetical protein A2724_05040 [Fluviicola sp. RIFCSPHIGHO2_01_FULL_43_53]OGS89662.1 MAG: hypothetical protein A3E30_01785 [Fluviicola sp. RIFCSPHIGHO2_12_FULL_43_24]